MDALKVLTKLFDVLAPAPVKAIAKLIIGTLHAAGQLRKPDGKEYTAEEVAGLWDTAAGSAHTLIDEAAASTAAIRGGTE
jgi:hypothetical protein